MATSINPGAGSGKGLTALPDVDDSVLVMLLDDDPSQGVILGGVWSEGNVPEHGGSSGAITSYSLTTKDGQEVVLDDAAGSVAVKDKNNNEIVLDGGGLKIHAAGDLTIEAPGKTITISASKVDFKQG